MGLLDDNELIMLQEISEHLIYSHERTVIKYI